MHHIEVSLNVFSSGGCVVGPFGESVGAENKAQSDRDQNTLHNYPPVPPLEGNSSISAIPELSATARRTGVSLPMGLQAALRRLNHSNLVGDLGSQRLAAGEVFSHALGKLSKDLFEAADRAVRCRRKAERVRQHAAEPDNFGRVLLVGQWFVMVGSDLDEFLRKLPGCYQQPSGAAVIDSEGLAFALQHITARAGCHSVDEVSVDLGIDGGQGHPADVMQNAGGVSEVTVDRVPARDPFRDHCAGETVTPTSLLGRSERLVHVRPVTQGYD